MDYRKFIVEEYIIDYMKLLQKTKNRSSEETIKDIFSQFFDLTLKPEKRWGAKEGQDMESGYYNFDDCEENQSKFMFLDADLISDSNVRKVL